MSALPTWRERWPTARARVAGGTVLRVALLLAVGATARLTAARYDELRTAPWVLHPESGHAYALVGPHLSWDDAQGIAQHWGGTLACLETASENAWVRANLLQLPCDAVWLGAREAGREGAWQWTNGAPWGYTHWGEGEPNNRDRTDNRLLLHRDGLWNDADPDDWLPRGELPRYYGLVERDRAAASLHEPLLWQLLAWRGLTLLLAASLLGRAAAALGVGQRQVWFGAPPPWSAGWAAPWLRLSPRGWLLLGALAAGLLLGRGHYLASHPRDHAPWVRSPVSGQWYALLPAHWSWSEVRARALALGADLAVVPSAAESEWIAEALCSAPGPCVYLGLREVIGNGRWEWVDGSPLTFVYRRPGLPLDLAADPAPNNVMFIWGYHDQRRFDPRDQFGERHGCWETITDPLVDDLPDELRPAYGLLQRHTSPYRPTPLRLAGAAALLLLSGLLALLRSRWRDDP
ncbi:MAG: C-type lectin domain-containing protein [Fimbriimonadaceae bacterium]|nr:C-type lectin domain-containing protein [Fimbriimonadaceae bacterium]